MAHKRNFIATPRIDGTCDIEHIYTGRSFIGSGNEKDGYALTYDFDNKKDLCYRTTNAYGQDVVKTFTASELEKELDVLCDYKSPEKPKQKSTSYER